MAAIAMAVLIALNLHGVLASDGGSTWQSRVSATSPPSPLASISGYIWHDDNGDGVQDEIEDGMAGVTVDLYFDNDGVGTLDPDDTWVDTQTSAEDGSYRFSDLSAGDYIVYVTDTGGVLSDYALTTDNNPLSVHLGEGEAYSGSDFGYEAVAYPGDTAITLSSFAARSSAGLEAPSVWLWLAGVVTLAMSGILWMRRRSNKPGYHG